MVDNQETNVPTTILGAADIASALDVSRPTFSNYLRRYSGTPAPSYVTPNGRQYWDTGTLDAWHAWLDGDDDGGA